MTIQQRILALMASTFLLAGAGLLSAATDTSPAGAPTAVELPDATLGDRVETLLRTDIGLAGSQFRVQSKGGVITLVGNVPDEHALRRALDLASGVRGVREIRNNMVVDAPK